MVVVEGAEAFVEFDDSFQFAAGAEFCGMETSGAATPDDGGSSGGAEAEFQIIDRGIQRRSLGGDDGGEAKALPPRILIGFSFQQGGCKDSGLVDDGVSPGFSDASEWNAGDIFDDWEAFEIGWCKVAAGQKDSVDINGVEPIDPVDHGDRSAPLQFDVYASWPHFLHANDSEHPRVGMEGSGDAFAEGIIEK